MRVAIDMSPIIYGTGVSNYRINLVKKLLLKLMYSLIGFCPSGIGHNKNIFMLL